MADEPDLPAATRGIGREELRLVIRRAAELYAAEADSAERLEPEEVLRIAEELGLPSPHVRQALYELPLRRGDPGWLDRVCGVPAVAASRAVPGRETEVLAQLEDYLLTQEYLRVLRRQKGSLLLAPAEDVGSKLVRAFRRPGSRHYIARAPRLSVAVQPLEADRAHVIVEADLSDRRGGHVAAGATLGGLAGAGIATGLFFAAAVPLSELVGFPGAATAGVLVGAAGLAGSVRAGLAIAGRRFRRLAEDARTELEGVLDRLERGRLAEPSPSPLRRLLEGAAERKPR